MITTHFVPLRHGRRHPPLVNEPPQGAARADWLYNAAEELLRGNSVSFQRRMRPKQGVTAEEFALAVDEYVNGRLADSEVHTSALGWLSSPPSEDRPIKPLQPNSWAIAATRWASLAGSPKRCLNLSRTML